MFSSSTYHSDEDLTEPPDLYICEKYQRQDQEHLQKAETCQALHICEQFIRTKEQHMNELGDKKCDLSHEFLAKDVMILNSFGISANHHPNTITLISDVLFPTDHMWPRSKIPGTCQNYNTSAQCLSSCSSLHICARLGSIRGCKNQKNKCSMAHTLLNDREKQKLTSAGFYTESKHSFKLYLKLLKQKNNPTPGFKPRDPVINRRNITEAKPEEYYRKPIFICTSFLSGSCPDENKCNDIHLKCLFAWQYKCEGYEWEPFETYESEALEAKYTMPEIDSGILDGEEFKILYYFNEMRAKIYYAAKIYTIAKIRRVEPRGMQWNFFYRFRSPNPWRIFKKIHGSGINSQDLDKKFQLLEENESCAVEFTIKNMDRKSKITVYMVKCFGDELIFQMSSHSFKTQIIKRRPHWSKPSIEEYLKIQPKLTYPTDMSNQSPVSEVDNEGNCLFHLEKPCKRESCKMYGYKDLDFLWVLRKSDSSNWQNVPKETCVWLDRNLRDVQIYEVTLALNEASRADNSEFPFTDVSEQLIGLNLGDMSRESSKDVFSVIFDKGHLFRCKVEGTTNTCDTLLRRLNYSSSPWQWYWEDHLQINAPNIPPAIPKILKLYGYSPKPKWVPYGKVGCKNILSYTSSKIIEHHFLKNHTGKFTIAVGDAAHEIDFKTFQQINLKTKKSRRVLRRPEVRDLKIASQNLLASNVREISTQNLSKKFRQIHSGENFQILKEIFDPLEGYCKSYFPFEDDQLKQKYNECRERIIETRQLENLNETILLMDIPVFQINEGQHKFREAVSECFKKGAQFKTTLVARKTSQQNDVWINQIGLHNRSFRYLKRTVPPRILVSISRNIRPRRPRSKVPVVRSYKAIDPNFYAVVVALVCAGKIDQATLSITHRINDNEPGTSDSYVDNVENPTRVVVTKYDQICPCSL